MGTYARDVHVSQLPQSGDGSWIPPVPTPCREFPDMFDRDAPKEDHLFAASLCTQCPFTTQCRLAAVDRGDEGVFGGWLHRHGTSPDSWSFLKPSLTTEVRASCPIPGCIATPGGRDYMRAHLREEHPRRATWTPRPALSTADATAALRAALQLLRQPTREESPDDTECMLASLPA